MSTKQIAWVALAIALMRERYTTPEGAWELAEGIHEQPPWKWDLNKAEQAQKGRED